MLKVCPHSPAAPLPTFRLLELLQHSDILRSGGGRHTTHGGAFRPGARLRPVTRKATRKAATNSSGWCGSRGGPRCRREASSAWDHFLANALCRESGRG
eukprot:364508-Chlamydomonas_euryale.AAC.4